MQPQRTDTDTIDVAPSTDYEHREVPDEIAAALSALAGMDETPTTLGAFDALTRTEAFSPGKATIDEMLITDESRHEVQLADRTVNTYCILDALVLAYLTDEPIEVTTRPPGLEETIEFTASREGIQGAEEEMVVSFGFSTALPTDRQAYEDSSVEQIHDTTHRYGCPKINLFPDEAAYEVWAREADAVTMALTLAEALGLARDTVESWEL